MACSLNIFSCIEDVNRVVSLLADSKPDGEKQDEDEKSESKPGGKILYNILNVSKQYIYSSS